jgi:hypothetical protein
MTSYTKRIERMLETASNERWSYAKTAARIRRMVSTCEHEDYKEYQDGSGQCNDCGAQMPVPVEI